jgi:hypothetical protein
LRKYLGEFFLCDGFDLAGLVEQDGT